MHLFSFLLCISLGALVKGETGSDWCYTGCNTTPEKWADLPESSCGSDRQSPISIVTNLVETNHYLDNFAFTNFDNQYINKSIINTGHTVKINLMEEEVEVTGGGLSETYSTIQFHFHWSSEEHNQGSEHMIDGHRYAMEMHIVSLKKGLTVEEAVQDSEGIAVLAFFINATEDDENMSGPWSNLTSYLTDITGAAVDISHHFSINDLIGNVNLTKFYRYMGSLTTPNCSEAVVWTVFKEPINVSKNLIKKFPMDTKLTNNYRPTQHLNERRVFASPATTLAQSPPWCYDEHCNYQPSNWHVLPYSHCDGESQSPINIETNTVIDKNLGDFSFTGFENKKAFAKITNTGHTVKCILQDNVVEVSEGGLGYVYSTIQFHFHWGSLDSNGSEHTVDSHRYPMEMHIVNKRKGLTVDEAVEIPDLAVLGFFIEEMSGNETQQPASWNTLTSYLANITNSGDYVLMAPGISLDDLLVGVDRTKYYRYLGSLTTPTCDEAVVWTVFKDSIKVSKDLIDLFSTTVRFPNSLSPLMTNVFRNVQPAQPVTTQAASSSATSKTCYSLGLMALSLALGRSWGQ
ncbi:carbonic anhydrase-like [Morone saxatilis]|uniref:carbonic anhydrase-like n=1 Tax=Morone saxatilis TaxID=34816 RepID=UPI0015E1BAEE|nr:carbonic anhydrase-like [Morone saxatilis]